MSREVVTLKYNEKEDEESGPVLASFRNGPPPRDSIQSSNGMDFELFSRKKQKLLLCQTEKLYYQGANFGHHNPASDLSKNIVGVYDKNTNEVQLYDIDNVFVMQQTIKGFRPNIHEHVEEENYMDRKRALVDAFGNKASKRIQKTFEENRVNTNNVSGSIGVTKILEKTVQNALDEKEAQKEISKDTTALDKTRQHMLPPHDVNATTPDKAYDPSKFVGTDENEALLMQAQEFMEEMENNVESREQAIEMFLTSRHIQSDFIYQRLIQASQPYQPRVIANIIYLGYLLNMYKLKYPIRKSMKDLQEETQIPFVLLQHMLTTFTSIVNSKDGKKRYMQPKSMKDKLMLYILAMALNTTNYAFDVNEIAKDLKRLPNWLGQFCRQLGCRVEKKKQASGSLASGKDLIRVSLKVPLRFPSISKGRN